METQSSGGVEIEGFGENDFPKICRFVSGCFPGFSFLGSVFLGSGQRGLETQSNFE